MIAIEFASDEDACLVLKALPPGAQEAAYFRPAVAAVPDVEGEPGQDSSPSRLYVVAEYEAAAQALAADLPTARKASLVAYAADVRWRREVSGVEVNGVPVATDDRSKLMITGARVAAAADPDWTTVWHGSDGQTYPIDAAAMTAISDAVQAHVNAGFATFASIKVGIESGEITEIPQIEAAFGL